MKKIFCILMVSMVILTGCASGNNANSIKDGNNVVEIKENNTNDKELFNELQEFALSIGGDYTQVPICNYIETEDNGFYSMRTPTDEERTTMINHIDKELVKIKVLIDKCSNKPKSKEVLEQLYEKMENEKEIPNSDISNGYKVSAVSIYFGVPTDGTMREDTFFYNLNEAMKVDFPKYKEKTFEDGEELRERALKYYNEAKSNMK